MSLANILTASLLVSVVAGVVPATASGVPDGPPPAADRSPRVALWTNRDDGVFQRGDPMTVFVRTDVDAYVTVFRLDTDGFVRILFPARPHDDSFVRGGAPHPVRAARQTHTVRIDEYPGEGFLFAVVTLDPIALSAFARNREWDYRALGLDTRVTGDPYATFSDLLAMFVPETYRDYDYAVTPYFVGARHDYPRFLCYQCHAYTSPAVWDPYAHSCIRVDPPKPLWWRYPFDAYGGTVVVTPPRSLPPGFVVSARPAAASPTAVPGRRPAPAPVAAAPRAPTNAASKGRRPSPTAAAPVPAPAARGSAPTPARRSSPPTRRDAGRTGQR